jgi:hypothetical protein
MRKSLRERFADMTRLYHFTNFDAACKIIESKQLRFGKLSRMNDLIENNKIVFQRVIFGSLEKDKENGLFAEEEMHRYQQISFSQDKYVDGKIYEGFNLHPMWGLYADRGYGVCLVFDKKKLKLADGDFTNHIVVVSQVIFTFDAVEHPLELFLLQSNKVGVVPVVILGQQTLIGMYRVPSFHCFVCFNLFIL